MRQVAEFPTEKAAHALADYLEIQHIETMVRDGDSFEVWVLDDDLITRAQVLAANHKPKANHAEAAQKIREKRERAAKPLPALPSQQRTGNLGASPVTLGLLGASILVALASSQGDTSTEIIRALLVVPVQEVLLAGVSQTMAPVDLVWSQPWRLVTPMLIHFGLLHLAFNMMWLHYFGTQIEGNHGSKTLVMLAIAAQAAGSVAQFEMSGPMFGGMSGVNYALFSFVWMQSRYGQRGYAIERRDTVLLMGWLILAATGLVGPVANACHALGLATGLIAGVPAYRGYHQKHHVKRGFEAGSWEDLNIRGWQRFDRLYVQPFVPLWFMAIALAVLFGDLAL